MSSLAFPMNYKALSAPEIFGETAPVSAGFLFGNSRMGCIYLVTNKINGKQYIGKTSHSMGYRISTHKCAANRGSNLYFHCALRKYGFIEFEWNVVEENNDPKELNRLEIEYVVWYETIVPNGYNLSSGGDGSSGFIRSKEWREKVSRALTGRPLSDETKRKIGDSHRGKPKKPHTKEAREKQRLAMLGKRHSNETKIKMSIAHKGKRLSKEHRAKISASLLGKTTGKKLSVEHRAKIGAKSKGRVCSLQTRKKISDSLKR